MGNSDKPVFQIKQLIPEKANEVFRVGNASGSRQEPPRGCRPRASALPPRLPTLDSANHPHRRPPLRRPPKGNHEKKRNRVADKSGGTTAGRSVRRAPTASISFSSYLSVLFFLAPPSPQPCTCWNSVELRFVDLVIGFLEFVSAPAIGAFVCLPHYVNGDRIAGKMEMVVRCD
ncbi:calcineurin B-like protein [Musa troglodytarum]|uniref:Calcineurin B-like protein n=1 Tax=Musa troglodytarum TaxID=320322 RepID=A0A9E7FRF2_9LILI|nr:calcineurin B-like protein [Musa troglodytarum]